jgi:hypothetical protein
MSQPSEEIRQKLAKLREEFAGKSQEEQRLKQAYTNMEQIANRNKPPSSKAKGGVISASKRADGIAQRGKTRGKYL